MSPQLATNINNKYALSGLRPDLEVASLRMKGSLVLGRDAIIFKNIFFAKKTTQNSSLSREQKLKNAVEGHHNPSCCVFFQ